MHSPFDRLSEMSIERPKTAISISIIGILLLASCARFIVFDNSEDAFYPDTETTRLMYEIEDAYQPDVDFIRAIVRFDAGSLENASTWNTLASIEAEMIEDERFSSRHLPLFGGSANMGLASSAIFWQRTQDPSNDNWSANLESALIAVMMANESELAAAISSAEDALAFVPSVESPSSSEIESWDPGVPTEWLSRLDSGENNSAQLSTLIGLSGAIMSNRSAAQVGQILPLHLAAFEVLIPLNEIQKIDLRSIMTSMVPTAAESSPWELADKALVTLAVDASIEAEWADSKGNVATDASLVKEVISPLTQSLGEDLAAEHDSVEVTAFSFSLFEVESNASFGKEIGLLTSAAVLLLGIILYWRFRSLRDTSVVIVLTLLAVGATYGLSGVFRFEFNAAMNAIPILLLAIGVDYGLHVVARYREELIDLDMKNPANRETMADFSTEMRSEAIKRGTIFTSAALFIAIVTDMIGFLSFRLSSQAFLVTFGTVIAIGLFFIYLLSVTTLPAIMRLLPAQKIPLKRSVQVEEGAYSKWIGEQTAKPHLVIIAAVLLSLPVAAGINQLEIGFDFRDQLDMDSEAVLDFLVLNDEFGSSPAPMYVVVDGPAITPEGRAAYESGVAVLQQNSQVIETDNFWDVLALEGARNSELQDMLDNLNASDLSTYEALESWLTGTEDGREMSYRYLRDDGNQAVILFQAPTVDWQATVDFESELSDTLSEEGDMYSVTGRYLLRAQVSADVAYSAVASTAIVASVILVTLIIINLIREPKTPAKSVARGVIMWVPLAMVVVWIYGLMGWMGYQLNSQSVTIGALALGLGVDYAVHFETRLREEMEHHPLAGRSAWVSRTSATTGRAMMGAALTTAGGFAVLNMSSILPLRLFGQVFVIAITLALVSSLMLLPCLMSMAGLLPESPESEEE